MIITGPTNPPPGVDPTWWETQWEIVTANLDAAHANGTRAKSAVKKQQENTDAANTACVAMTAATEAAGL
jgi:hypothetical protein